MSERDDACGDLFAGLTPVHCSGVIAAKKIGGDLHVVYYDERQAMISGEVFTSRKPCLYLVLSLANIVEGRKLVTQALHQPNAEPVTSEGNRIARVH